MVLSAVVGYRGDSRGTGRAGSGGRATAERIVGSTVSTHVTCTQRRARTLVRRMGAGAGRAVRVGLVAALVCLALPQGALAVTFPADPQALAPASLALAAVQPAGTVVIDYPGGFNSSTPARLKRNGVGVAIRYVGAARWKSLRRSEANALRKAGIDIAAVYETKANWMLGGRKAGVAAAKKARAAVIACGGPKRPFIYFACDVATRRYSTVNACLQGAASVLGADHVGIYGSYAVCAEALKSGYATKAWQTEAWSNGKVLATSAIYQRAHRINGNLGLDYDSNLVRADDLGQWGYSAPGGESWTAASAPSTATLTAVDFAGASSGWAVGEGGAIAHTDDGGATWAAQSAPTTAALNSVTFTDANTGLAVGEGGALIRTTDGGEHWAPHSQPATETLRSLDFWEGRTGFAVGEGGAVVYSADGGASWNPQSSHTTATLRAVRMGDYKTAWAVGASGTIVHTTTGGAAWVLRSSGTTATLNSIDAFNARVAWAVGEGGTILRTNDCGVSWTRQSSPTSATLTSVRFTDISNGWVVGEGGTVLRTANGGATWNAQTPPCTSTLLSAEFADAHTGWAVGSSGAALRCVGTRLGPFGTVAGVVTDAVTGAPISGVKISVGPAMAAPTSPDGTFVAARLAPGTSKVTFSNYRYVSASVSGVVVRAGGRTTVKIRMTPRTVTSLAAPSVAPTIPVATQPTTLTVILSPSSAATAGATTITGWHYEQKTVVKKVKRKKKKVKVWYWRQRFVRVMSVQEAGRLSAVVGLARGKWRVQARFAGSATFLPVTSATRGFAVY